jgi:hypothetical protein
MMNTKQQANLTRRLRVALAQNRILKNWMRENIALNFKDALWQDQWFELRESALGALDRCETVAMMSDRVLITTSLNQIKEAHRI